MLDEHKTSQMLKYISSKIYTYKPFNNKICEFLSEVSSDLLKNKKIIQKLFLLLFGAENQISIF